ASVASWRRLARPKGGLLGRPLPGRRAYPAAGRYRSCSPDMPIAKESDMPEPVNPKPPPADPPKPSWSGWIVLVLLLAAMWAWQLFGHDKHELPTIPYSAFYSLVDEGKVQSVTVSGQAVSGKLGDQQVVDNRPIREFRTTLPSQPDAALFPLLREKKV